jgi:hypothetical protein
MKDAYLRAYKDGNFAIAIVMLTGAASLLSVVF